MASELFSASLLTLNEIIRELDITESQYKQAVAHYDAVGEWLNDKDSSIRIHAPRIYPQGSIRLGTVVKPHDGRSEYDVDIVCELSGLSDQAVDPVRLRKLIGDRLAENAKYESMMKPSHRCWTLNYAEATQFHMDILPAIPDVTRRERTDAETISAKSILITDDRIPDWLKSDPDGYATWFEDRMKPILEEIRKSLKYASIQDIPYHERKTSLQKCVQLLKRHRDVTMGSDEHKPTSIIITTLAGLSYHGANDMYDALFEIVNTMESQLMNNNGKIRIENPTNADENFADKWESSPLYFLRFREWLDDAKNYVASLPKQEKAQVILESMGKKFGVRLAKSAAAAAAPDLFKVAYPETKVFSIAATSPKPWGR